MSTGRSHLSGEPWRPPNLPADEPPYPYQSIPGRPAVLSPASAPWLLGLAHQEIEEVNGSVK
jgi:hypothetical protein